MQSGIKVLLLFERNNRISLFYSMDHNTNILLFFKLIIYYFSLTLTVFTNAFLKSVSLQLGTMLF
jgi:hypothetical protein